MQLGFAFLADAAQDTPDGKISVLGGNFDTIYAARFPTSQPAMSLVVNLRVQPTECGREHRLRVEFLNEDGGPLIPRIELGFLPQKRADAPHRPVNVNLIAVLQGVPFSRAGEYGSHILVDDLELGVLPLYLVQAQTDANDPARHAA